MMSHEYEAMDGARSGSRRPHDSLAPVCGVVGVTLATILGLGLGPAPTPAFAANPVTVSGRVTYESSGAGIPNENVTLHRKAKQSGPIVIDTVALTLTTAQGYYSFDVSGLPEGEYALRFGLPYFHRTRAEYWDNRTTLQDPTLFYLAPTYPSQVFNASLKVGPTIPTSRIAGSDRFATSAAIASKYAVPTVENAVFVASGMNFPDALSAAPVAGALGSPLVLVKPDSVPASVCAQIERLEPEEIILVGGPGAVSTAVENDLATIAPVTRISGSNRYATSREIINTFYGSIGELFVATGRDFADALSSGAAAGAAGIPVLLVDGKADSLDTEAHDFIESLAPSQITIVGGPGAVSEGIESDLAALATVERLNGRQRYETSWLVNKHVFTTASKALLATGDGFADALAGAAYGAVMGYPLFLTPSDCLDVHVWSVGFFGFGTAEAILLGGAGALSQDVANLLDCQTVRAHP
jgi:putative cell wall-binding protein